MSLPAVSKDTVLLALKNLHTNFIVKLGFKWLVVGDAKTIVQRLRRQYGSPWGLAYLVQFPEGFTKNIW